MPRKGREKRGLPDRAASVVPEASALGLPALENLARIHDAVRIEAVANLAHQPDLERILVSHEILALELADAMFSADAAVVARHFVQYFGSQPRAMLGEEIARRACRARQVVVKIAVAEMAEH